MDLGTSHCEQWCPSRDEPELLDDVEDFGQLCSLCRNIDFESAFTLTTSQTGRYGVAITKTRKDVDPTCVLCSFVASRLLADLDIASEPVSAPKLEYHLRALDSMWFQRRGRTPRDEASSSVVIIVMSGESKQVLEMKQVHEAVSRGFILPLAQGLSSTSSTVSQYSNKGRFVSHLHANFPLIATWLDDCRESKANVHRGCRSVTRKIDFCLRVIDCWTRQIVQASQDTEYLALSYVWGSKASDAATQQAVHLSCSVPSPGPQTIEDAMYVVRKLGKRYLWVDRFCIWDLEDKHTQIQNMDQVYCNALSTIVASDAESAKSGLRGVSLPRERQYKFRTETRILVSTFPHVSHHLSRSAWATRGWTYQEALLSRSCLFFTKDQVYFVCKAHIMSEAVEKDPVLYRNRFRESLRPRLMKWTEQIQFNLLHNEQPFFYEHIKEYTSRSLTFDSDALNAFKGIIVSWHEYTYWGIPFTTANPNIETTPDTAEGIFAQGLAWIGKRLPPGGGQVRRRKDLPSWSWISLIDQIETRDKDHKVVPGMRSSALFVEDENQKLLSIKDVFRSAQGKGTLVIPEHGRNLFLSALVIQVYLRSTGVEGAYSAYLPSSSRQDQKSCYSPPQIVRQASIDGGDVQLLSKIESRPWDAVELFWNHIDGYTSRVHSGCWMIVDKLAPVARRIGIIMPESLLLTGEDESNIENIFRRELIKIQ